MTIAPPAKRTTHVPHGTTAGYARHVNTGEQPCADCAQAHKEQRWENEKQATARRYRRIEEGLSFNTALLADWQKQAACDGQQHIFDRTYESTHVPGARQAVRIAMAICAACPVIEQCRAAGDARETTTDTHGVLAGETAKARITRRQKAAREAA